MQPELKVTVFWGDILYDTALCPPKSTITVGKDAKNTFMLDLPRAGSPMSLPLVRVHGAGEAEVQFDDQIVGHVRYGQEFLTFDAAKKTSHATRDSDGYYHLRLGAGDRADMMIGHVSFYLDWVTNKEKLPKSWPFTASNFVLSLFFLAAFGCVLYFVPNYTAHPETEPPPERLVKLLPQLPVPPKPEAKPKPAPVPRGPKEATKAALGERKTKDGGAEKGAAGKAQLTRPIPDKSRAKAARNSRVRVVEGATRHKAATGSEAPAAEGEWTGKIGNVVKGLSSLGAEAPVVGTGKGLGAPIDQTGTGGFTTQGLKTGGGGKSVGVGRTVGNGEGGFEGTGRLGLAGNSAVEGGTGTGRGTSSVVGDGGLDRDVIDSIIRRRQDRIRLCYERQLNFNPHLSGKITVAFVIGKAGEVIRADVAEDTMKNASVRACVLKEVRTWTFPKPRGGTLVKVDYPFVFESSGLR